MNSLTEKKKWMVVHSLGLIRLLLALSVVFSHSEPFVLTGTSFAGGLVAVEAFFIISGFYMALVLESKYSDKTMAFYRNRFLRIFPTYWTILLLAVVATLFFGENKLEKLIDGNFSVGTLILMLVSNAMIFGSDMMMFFSTGIDGLFVTGNFQNEEVKLYEYHYIPQAWTLPLELIFYLIVPFFSRKLHIIIALLIVSLLIKVLTLQAFGRIDPWIYRFFPSELMMFCLGMLSHRLYLLMKGRIRSAYLGPIALFIIACCTIWFESIAGSMQFRMAAYFLMMVIFIPVIFDHFRHNDFDQMIGELSYPIYLCHLIVIGAVKYFEISILGDQTVLYVIGCVVLSWLVHRYVSEPIEHRFRAPIGEQV